MAEIGMQADLEQKQDNADLREQLDEIVRLDQAQETGSEDDSCAEFADNAQCSEARCDFGRCPRYDEYRGNLEQYDMSFHL